MSVRFAYVLAMASVFIGLPSIFPQTLSPPATLAKANVVFAEVSDVIYPPLARQTRIQGDVQLELKVRKDGSIVSVDFVKGHPLLAQAALESARSSRYRCIECVEEVTSQILIYTYQIAKVADCCNFKPSELPEASTSENRVTVSGAPSCLCDPASTNTKARSLRCLYLWHCRAIRKAWY